MAEFGIIEKLGEAGLNARISRIESDQGDGVPKIRWPVMVCACVDEIDPMAKAKDTAKCRSGNASTDEMRRLELVSVAIATIIAQVRDDQD